MAYSVLGRFRGVYSDFRRGRRPCSTQEGERRPGRSWRRLALRWRHTSSSCSQSGSASRARRPARRRPARRRRAAPRPRPRSKSRRGASDRTPSTTRSTSGCAGMFQSSNQTRFAFVAIDRFGSMGESDRFGSLSPIVYLRRTLQLGGQCLSPPSPRGMTIRDFAAPLAWPLPNHKVLTPTSYVLGDEARFAAFYVRHRRVAAGF